MEKGKIGTYLRYAIGEIILVVIGILIALQINNLNEQRKDAEKEQVFLEQIHIEFLENKSQFEVINNHHLSSLKGCNWMIQNQPFTSVPLDSLRYHSKQSRIAYTFDPSQSSIESLINNGSIDLIQDASLEKH